MPHLSSAVAAALSLTALAQCANANLIVNGDFSAGFRDFGSDYFFVGQDGSSGGSAAGGSSLQSTGTFVVTANANNWHPNFDSLGDHTTGEGQMLVANGSTQANQRVWTQFVDPGLPARGGERLFEFTFWARTVFPSSPPSFRVLVNGEPVGSDAITIPESNQEWSQYTVPFQWSVPVAERGFGFQLSIVDVNLDGFGNDFALDDLSLIEVPGPGVGGALALLALVGARRRRAG